MHIIVILDSSLITYAHHSTSPLVANVICRAETTGVLSWPDTVAGTNHSLQCPNTSTMINRTCSSSGVWDMVDPSLCTPFDSINTVSISVGFSVDLWCGPSMLLDLQANITLDNYGKVLTSLSGAVRGAAINEQIQNTNNLARVAAAFQRSAALINERTIITNAVSSLAWSIMV